MTHTFWSWIRHCWFSCLDNVMHAPPHSSIIQVHSLQIKIGHWTKSESGKVHRSRTLWQGKYRLIWQCSRIYGNSGDNKEFLHTWMSRSFCQQCQAFWSGHLHSKAIWPKALPWWRSSGWKLSFYLFFIFLNIFWYPSFWNPFLLVLLLHVFVGDTWYVSKETRGEHVKSTQKGPWANPPF